MRGFLLNLTTAFTTLAAAFAYSGFYCLNTGEPDIAEGLWTTFAIPLAFAAFIALAGLAATPRERGER